MVFAAISGAAFGAAFTAAFGEAEAPCSAAGGKAGGPPGGVNVLPAAPDPLVRDRSRSAGSKSNSPSLGDGLVHGAGASEADAARALIQFGIGGSWGNVSGDGTACQRSSCEAGVDVGCVSFGRDAGGSGAGSEGGSTACQSCRAAASCVCTTSSSSGSKGAE